jgi:hypothetical protein
VTGTFLGLNRLPATGAGFIWETTEALLLRPDCSDVVAAFTTRVGGVSEGPFASWNVSYAVGDDRDRVEANRETANRSVGRAGATSWGRTRQVHGRDVVRWHADAELRAADAVWTDDPDEVVAVFGADCVPVLLVGDGRVAAAHAGWRGLVAGVVEAAATAIGATHAFIGPGIGPCCYDVGEDAAAPLRERFGAGVMSGRFADLWAAVRASAVTAGVASVYTAELCTSCHEDLFFSHRRDRGRTGRQALVARLSDG